MTLAEQRSGSSSWRVAAAARFEREVLRAFDGAVTLSEIDARTLRSLLPLHSIATVPSGTDIVDVGPCVPRFLYSIRDLAETSSFEALQKRRYEDHAREEQRLTQI